MSKHTKGPWKTDGSGIGVYSESTGTMVAGATFPNLQVARADAQMIAAAPELLNALELVKAHLSDPECAIWRHVHAVMDAAISKATGA
jgi:hypothetical protein